MISFLDTVQAALRKMCYVIVKCGLRSRKGVLVKVFVRLTKGQPRFPKSEPKFSEFIDGLAALQGPPSGLTLDV